MLNIMLYAGCLRKKKRERERESNSGWMWGKGDIESVIHLRPACLPSQTQVSKQFRLLLTHTHTEWVGVYMYRKKSNIKYEWSKSYHAEWTPFDFLPALLSLFIKTYHIKIHTAQHTLDTRWSRNRRAVIAGGRSMGNIYNIHNATTQPPSHAWIHDQMTSVFSGQNKLLTDMNLTFRDCFFFFLLLLFSTFGLILLFVVHRDRNGN